MVASLTHLTNKSNFQAQLPTIIIIIIFVIVVTI